MRKADGPPPATLVLSTQRTITANNRFRRSQLVYNIWQTPATRRRSCSVYI